MTGSSTPAGTSEERFELIVASYLLPDPALATPPVGSAGLELAELARIVQRRGGCWVSAAPQAAPSAFVRPITLNPTEAEAFNDGQCQSTLGPLYQGQPAQFDRRWSEAYRVVNRRHAAAIAAIAAPSAAVLVYDYHLQLVPGMLRRLRPDLTIAFALSGGFPPAELFYQLPDRADLITGLLGADVIAVGHRRSQRAILDLAHELAGRPHTGTQISVGRRQVTVAVAPIPSATATVAELAAKTAVRARAAQIRASLDAAGTVLLSIAGPSEAEGGEARMAAFGRLLADQRLDPNRDAFVHLALGEPGSSAQRELRARVERLAARINGEYATVGRCVVHYLNAAPDAAELTASYLACDVLIATPSHGGPVAVAAEFTAARAGRVVLSELTTTVGELPDAHVVNPRDGVALQDAIAQACVDTDPVAGRPAAYGQLTGWLDGLLAPAGRLAEPAPSITRLAVPKPRPQAPLTASTH